MILILFLVFDGSVWPSYRRGRSYTDWWPLIENQIFHQTGPSPVWSQVGANLRQVFCFFDFLSTRKTGSWVAQNLCSSRTKNCLWQGLGWNYHDQQDRLKLCDHHLNKTELMKHLVWLIQKRRRKRDDVVSRNTCWFLEGLRVEPALNQHQHSPELTPGLLWWKGGIWIPVPLPRQNPFS